MTLTDTQKHEVGNAYLDAFVDRTPMTSVLFKRDGTLMVEPPPNGNNIREWVAVPVKLHWH